MKNMAILSLLLSACSAHNSETPKPGPPDPASSEPGPTASEPNEPEGAEQGPTSNGVKSDGGTSSASRDASADSATPIVPYVSAKIGTQTWTGDDARAQEQGATYTPLDGGPSVTKRWIEGIVNFPPFTKSDGKKQYDVLGLRVPVGVTGTVPCDASSVYWLQAGEQIVPLGGSGSGSGSGSPVLFEGRAGCQIMVTRNDAAGLVGTVSASLGVSRGPGANGEQGLQAEFRFQRR